MTDIAKRPTNPQADDGEELWGKLEHRKFEGDPQHDAYPEWRYDADTQKEMLGEIERQKKLVQVPTRADIDGADRGIRHATDPGEILPRVREIGVRCVAHPVIGVVTDRDQRRTRPGQWARRSSTGPADQLRDQSIVGARGTRRSLEHPSKRNGGG
jgi:hypothetical protein